MLVATLIALALLGAVVSARAAEDVTGALDLVILLDNSGSMYGNYQGNDDKGYRYDAAAIILNMCNATGCRAAVYEFGNTTTPVNKTEGLLEIDIGYGNRERLTKNLIERETAILDKDGTNNTNLGGALIKAIEILDEAEATRDARQPVILVLADGANNDPDKMEQAKVALEEKHYKVYTVFLGLEKGSDDLRKLSEETGGRSWMLTDNSELPIYFSYVFADQTGAEMTYAKQDANSIGGGKWQVKVNIPNRSVKECNIVVPALELSNITMQRPNGRTVNDSADSKVSKILIGVNPSKNTRRFPDEYPRFVMYKILNPDDSEAELGEWLLTFETDDASAASKSSATVVFNYNLELRTDKTQLGGNKGTQYTLNAKFYTPEGVQSSDDMLYRGGANAITCRAYLVSDPDAELAENAPYIELQPNEQKDGFTATFSYMDFPNSARDKVGDYYLIVRASGDGMVRTAEPILFSVTNAAPEEIEDIEELTLKINDPRMTEDARDSHEIDLTHYFQDKDGWEDIVDISVGESASLLKIEENGTNPTNGFRITTKKEAGETLITAIITDACGEQLKLEFPIRIQDVGQTLRQEYSAVLQMLTQPNSDGYYQRGQTIQLEAKSRLNDGVSRATFDLADFDAKVVIYRINSDGEREGAPIQLENSLGEFTLDGKGGDYLLRAYLNINGEEDVDQYAELKLSTGNVEPNVKESSVWTHEEATVGGEKWPLPVWPIVNSERWQIAFDDMFEDKNVADTLTFTYLVKEGGDLITIEEVEDENGLSALWIQPKEAGTVKITLTATDDSKDLASVSQDYTFSSKDEYVIRIAFLKKIAICVAAALLVIFILWKATRPHFRSLSLKVELNGIFQRDYRIPDNAKKVALSRYVPEGFERNKVSAITLKPARNGVKVVLDGKKRKNKGVSIKAGSGKLDAHHKKAILVKGRSIEVEYDGKRMTWTLEQAERKH